MTAKTLFDKIWDRVCVHELHGQALLFVDRHIGHEGSGGGFAYLRRNELPLRRPDLTFTSADHWVSTKGPTLEDIENPGMRRLVAQFAINAEEFGHTAFPLGDDRRGIVHVVGPEQGITQPGLLIVCGDSHTSTHGALGAFAFGIGSTELNHVVATQCLWQSKPKTMRVLVKGARPEGISAKDIILAIMAKIGANGATGHVVEYAGRTISDLTIEERMTICNMSIEAGARAGIIAPDEKTIDYLRDRPFSPKGAQWDKAVAYWRTLPTDEGASFDREVELDASTLAPMLTWGTSPENALPITAVVPDPADAADAEQRAAWEAALAYMDLTPGTPLQDIAVDRIFIGSCTNGRISDLRAAASILEGKTTKIPGIVVPGSTQVKLQAEAEGLDTIFKSAGLEWRESGCSMCCGFNGDIGAPKERWASTSNRNFVGRQGPEVRTHLVSPAMAAAAALKGHFTDVRAL